MTQDIQYMLAYLNRVIMVVSNYDLLTAIWLLLCLHVSAWAAANCAEIAEQSVNVVELKK